MTASKSIDSQAKVWLFAQILGCAAALLLSSGCTTQKHSRSQNLPTEAGIAGAHTEFYDSFGDGEQALAAALTQARSESKRVLLNLGANWCSDSRNMCYLLEDDPRIRALIERSYVQVRVDVNQRRADPRNPWVQQRFQRPLQRGIPVLLVLDSDGALLNTNSSERLRDTDHAQPGKVLRYLRKWAHK